MKTRILNRFILKNVLTASLLVTMITIVFNTKGQIANDSTYAVCGYDPKEAFDKAIEHAQTGKKAITLRGHTVTQSCGRFNFIFSETIADAGFFDPALGQQRRQCICEVAQHIESVIDIPIGDGSPIEIEVSYIINTDPNSILSRVVAYAYPTYLINLSFLSITPLPAGFHSSLMQMHMTTGNDPDSNQLDGFMVFNFAKDFNANCNSFETVCGAHDLFSVALHELTHAMGWISALKEVPTHGSTRVTSQYGSKVYTKFDEIFLYSGDANGAKTKVVNNSTLNIQVGTIGNNKLWLYDNLPNLNQPVLSLPVSLLESAQNASHLDDRFIVGRCHESPGFAPQYVMDGFSKEGEMIRQYTLHELRALEALGYIINWGNIGLTANNHPPYLQGSVITNEIKGFFAYNDIDIRHGFPGGNQNLYLTTNNCTPVRIDLSTRPELVDVDGDPIRIFPNSLYNIRGCGNDGNNHNQLTISSTLNGDIITFTPRSNFVGRAQFGFHLFDGNEHGSFVVYTIDVTRDNNCFNNGEELIINGNFEEGSEVALLNNPTIENHVSLIDISDVARPLPLWRSHLPDGMAINFSSADLIIAQSWNTCVFGHRYYSSNPGNHIPSKDTSNRYLQCVGGELVYYNLADVLTSCNKYTLKFDARVVPDPKSAEIRLHVGFNDHYGAGTAMLPIEIVLDTVTHSAKWFHFTFDFLFPFQIPYNWMVIEPVAAVNGASILFDNISLQQAPDNDLPIVLNIGNDITICSSNEILFNPGISGGTGAYNYFWEFGDGTTSTIRSPSHTYTNAGNYQAILTVSDEFGCVTPVTDEILVSVFPSPSPSFEVTDAPSFCPGESISFTGIITGGTSPLNILWNFGDGTTSNILSPDHVYIKKGNYYPSLTVIDATGCSDSIKTNVPLAVQGLIVNLMVPNIICTGGSVNFSAGITGGSPPYTYSWNFGDGIISNKESPDHSYQEGNKYFNYTLTATDINGCDGTASSTIYVQNVINVDIHNSDTVVCFGDAVGFNATISGGNTPYNYFWHDQFSFGNGFLSIDSSPNIIFNVGGGVNEITLEVTDNNGCIGKDYVNVDVSLIYHNVTTTPDFCATGVGSAKANPTGGTPPYLYSWNATNVNYIGYPNGETTQEILNLCWDNYAVDIVDVNGCREQGIGTVSMSFSDSFDFIGNYQVTGNEFWSSDKKVNGKIIINKGAKLTINNGAVIEIAPSTCYNSSPKFIGINGYEPRIEVKRGGKLIVDGATLSGLSSCNSMWDGIVVEGDPSKSHPNNGYISTNPHGFVHLKNGAKIENAKIGVLLGRESDIIYSESSPGGMLWADNSFFINNEFSVLFKRYDYLNNSKIQECLLEVNDLHRGKFEKFIRLEEVSGIKIIADTFRLKGTVKANLGSTGILSYNSSFKVIAAPGSTTTSTGTSVGKGNYFEGFTKGIDAYSTGGIKSNITVKNNTFYNVLQGITASGTSFDEISDNIFLVPPSVNIGASGNFPSWGIYLYNTTGYLVTGNTFENINQGTSNKISFGVISRNSSGFGGEIYKNRFDSITYIATQAEQNNYRLQIKCNAYNDNQNDWAITSGQLPDQGNCKGSNDNPAGNLFSKNCVNVSQIESAINFTYNHHIRTTAFWTVQPDCYTVTTVDLKRCKTTMNAGSCPSRIPSGTGGNTASKSKIPEHVINEKDPIVKQLLISDFLRNLLREDNIPQSAVIQVFQSLDNLEAKKILIPTFLAEKDFGDCRKTLIDIPYDTDENIQFHKLFDHLVNFCEQGKLLENMEDHEKQIIRDVSNTNTEVAVHAEAYLTQLDKKTYWREPERTAPLKMSKTTTGINQEDTMGEIESVYLYNFPNPFDNSTTIIAHIPDYIKMPVLEIYDVTGRIIKSYLLVQGRNEISLTVSELNKGIYIYKLLSETQVLISKKMVIY